MRDRILALFRAGSLNEAEQLARECRDACPDDFDLLELLAVIYQQLGEFEALAGICSQLVKLHPASAQYHFNLALALDMAGKAQEAATSYRDVLVIEPDNFSARYNLARQLYALDQPRAAVGQFREALRLQPDWPEAQNNLAISLRAVGECQAAIELLEQALAAQPGSARLLHTLGDTFDQDGQYGKALAAYQRALASAPEDVSLLAAVGRVLLRAGRPVEAAEHYRRVLEQHGGDRELTLGMVNLYEAMGDYKQACAMLLPLLKDSAEDAGIALKFADLCKYTGHCAEAIQTLEKLIESGGHQPETARSLRFALGRLLDDAASYDRAFMHFKEANMRKHARYDSGRFDAIVDTIIDAYPVEHENACAQIGAGDAGPGMIFIVGMPRSGTSLVEQILDCHSSCQGAGELDILPRLVAALANPAAGEGLPYPMCMKTITRERLTEYRAHYLSRVRQLVDIRASLVSDKMPENFLHLGLIELLFPDAKILHCVRDQLDTCLSCYFQEFSGTHEYAYDLASLGARYTQYQKLMAQWRRRLRIPIHDVSYEALVTNTRVTCLAMFDYLGLSWEEQCLQFHKSARLATTASQQQVKQPIYDRSIGRWKHYDRHIGDLRRALGREMSQEGQDDRHLRGDGTVP